MYNSDMYRRMYRYIQYTHIYIYICMYCMGSQLQTQFELGAHPGPMLDPSVGVYRIHGKAIRDGIVGWATVAGNQGTAGKSVAKVVTSIQHLGFMNQHWLVVWNMSFIPQTALELNGVLNSC